MSEGEDSRERLSGRPDRPDPHTRPNDPAGTKPKVDPDSLLPAVRAPLRAIESTAVEDRWPEHLLPEPVAAPGSPALGEPPREAPHAARFQFLLGALLTFGLAAVAIVVGLAVRGGSTGPSGPSWSPWRPGGDSGSVATQIADHVGREYHLSSGEQLVAVTGGPLEVAGLPLTIALRQAPARGGDIALIDGKGALYRLCGLGPKCAIDEGKPSMQRHLLLRRESLELALYTFRYTDVSNVVVFMPPRLGKDPTQALFFRRKDVDPELDRPLNSTLTRTAPLPDAVRRAPDSSFVNRLTIAHLFQFSLTQANQDNRAFLVLEPFDTQPR